MSTAFIFEKFHHSEHLFLATWSFVQYISRCGPGIHVYFPFQLILLLDRLSLLGNNGFDFLSPPSLLYGVEAFDYLLRLGILIAFCETRRAWHIVSLCCTLSCEILTVWGKKSGKEKWLIRAHAVSEEQNQEPGCILDILTSDYL